MLDTFRRNIAPPSDLHPADWAAKHVFVENSERSDRFDPEQTRWWRKVMGCYADYETKHMVCIMPTGAGKSTFFEAITCWIVSESPGSVLYASQTDGDAEFWGETRLLKAMKKCEPLNHLWPVNLRNSIRKDAMVFPHMYLVMGGANESNFQEKSITYGHGDEAWRWKRGFVAQWKARSHNRENRKFVLASQAGKIAFEDETGETDELHLEHDKCRKWDFAWKCPECSSVQPFRFEQLKFDIINRSNEIIDPQLTADTTRRVCPNESCKAEFADTPQIRRMLHDSYRQDDGYLMVSDDGQRGYEGFHVDRGAIWWCSWADDVLKKLQADAQLAIGSSELMEQWTMKDRAVGWSASNAVTKTELKPSGYTQGDYEEHRKIEGEVARFLTIDAGLEHWWAIVRAWAHGGSSKLLYFGYVGRETDLVKLAETYNVPPNCVFKDIGYQQTDMADIIARHGWRGIKGKGENGDNISCLFDWEIKNGPNKGRMEQRLYSKKKITKGKSGKAIEYFHMSTERLQYILQRLINGEGAKWEAYDDCPPTYVRHLDGERLGKKKNARGNEVNKWLRHGANHGRDCEAMNLCAAFMFKIFAPEAGEVKEVDEQESN